MWEPVGGLRLRAARLEQIDEFEIACVVIAVGATTLVATLAMIGVGVGLTANAAGTYVPFLG